MAHHFRRRRRPVRWSLAELLVAVTALAAMLGAGRWAYGQLGADECLLLLLLLAVGNLYLLGPSAARWLAEVLADDPVRRVAIGDFLLLCLAVPLLAIAAGAYNANGIMDAWMLLVVSLGSVWQYCTWRDDQLSLTLDAIERLQRMKPTVAILGASADREKFGNKSIRAHVKRGYEVFPVNPKGGEIEGLRVYRSLAEIPVPLARISVYLPPAIGVKAMDEVAAKGCEELFLNPGSDAPEVIDRARELGLDPIVACSIVAIGEVPD